MTSLFIHAALGALTIGVFFSVNAYLYRSDWRGSPMTFLEGLYYVLAVGSVCAGWFFNVRYVRAYPAEASWVHFTTLLFANPAAASGGQDAKVETFQRNAPKVGRNDPCPCGSGKKYKKCHGAAAAGA